jgi:RNA polymerase sigma factor (sigma-70 family)
MEERNMSESDKKTRREKYGPFWEKACEDSKQRLISYALRLANGRLYDAEDLFQDTVCRALDYSRNPEAISDPLGYLLRMMRNGWISKWRKENTDNVDSLDSNPALQNRAQTVEPTVLRMLENNDLQDEMSAKEGPLTPRESLLLKLYLAGYKCKEMALILSEDVRLTRSDLNAVKSKVRYRLKSGKVKTKGSGQP